MKRFITLMRRKTKAFSMAEALITLLIVCIIVLASVPVITKKRRNMDNSHGKYLCTLNSAGNYVEYYSRAAIGKEEDPDTWHEVTNSGYKDTVSWYNSDGQLLSKERFQCKFTPPPGARNFNVTVIGGGSGGRDGTSDYKELLNVTYPTSGSFTAKEENEYYNIILISGGGGGGGSPRDWNNGSAGYGGGGGAGGVIRAEELHLVKNASYSYSVGGGGAGGWGVMRGCCKPNKTDHDRAPSGGPSSFSGSNNGETVNFYIPGAQGGDSIGCTKKKCRGGGAGGGTSCNSITRQYASAKGSVVAYGGPSGAEGSQYCSGCGVLRTRSGGKNNVDSFQVDSNNYPIKYSYGSGGDGRGHGSVEYSGLAGSSGALIISQLNKLYGNGGNAGKISSRFVPSIEGHLVASIPLAAKSNEAGKQVVITAYKNKTNNGILARADGGALPGTNKEAPTDGEESPWTYKHAGLAAEQCSAVTNEGAGYETVQKEVQKCKKVGCELDEGYDVTFLKAFNTKAVVTNPEELPTMQSILPAGLANWSSNEDAYLDMVFEALPLSNASGTKLDAYLKSLNIYYVNWTQAQGLINADSSNLAQFDNADEFDNTGCFYDNNKLMYTKVCVSSYTDKKDDKVWHAGRRHQTCPAASDGQQFGAGGGGGTVGDIPGVFGKGGKGAPGAIIIEW